MDNTELKLFFQVYFANIHRQQVENILRVELLKIGDGRLFFYFFTYYIYMRHVRLTWEGAFHHIMNRGIEQKPVFHEEDQKNTYLEFLEEYSRLQKIRIFAYCIMDNHFHIVLENSSMRLSEFMRNTNSRYASSYRKLAGGKGYVFEDRFKSTIVQNESYLITLIRYILQNPVRSKIINDPFKYAWSSINLYFQKTKPQFIDTEFVEELFGTKKNFVDLVNDQILEELPEKRAKFGRVMGTDSFLKISENKFDRRSTLKTNLNKRITDKYFEPVEKIIHEFEKKIGKKIEEIITSTHTGKRERGLLLVNLKDYSGLKYKEIFEFDIFRDLKFNSMGHLYSRTKEQLKK